jgi:hypothetical protein
MEFDENWKLKLEAHIPIPIPINLELVWFHLFDIGIG